LKKIILIFLVSVYAMSVLGYGVEGFYCCGQLKSVTLTFQDYVNSFKKHDAKKCCDTKVHFFKVKDNHIASDQINTPIKFFTDANLFAAYFNLAFHFQGKAVTAYHCNAPPSPGFVPIFVLNCNFRI
jgi:hypothetical protein